MEISELLPALLAGTLQRNTEQEVLAHLAQCEQCRRELAFWAQVGEAVRAETQHPPKELLDNVFDDLRSRLFGERSLSVGESLRMAGKALSLAGSACRLALTMAGAR